MRGFFVLAAKKLAWGSIFLMLKQETLVFDSAFLAGGDGGFLIVICIVILGLSIVVN